MNSENIIVMLDKVAGDLEDKGLLKEAEMLDIVANTLEQSARLPEPNSDLYQGPFKKAIEAIRKAYQEINKGNANVKPLFGQIVTNLEKVLKNFKLTKEGLLGKGSMDSLDILVKEALEAAPEKEKKDILGMFDNLILQAERLISVAKQGDPADINDIIEKAKQLDGTWKMSDADIKKRGLKR